MVRADVVAAKIGRARTWLNDAEGLMSVAPDAFLADRRSRDLALFYLFLALQECIDIAAHWVADEGWGPSDEAGTAFDILADRGVLDAPSATLLRAAVGLRNRIAHGYAMLDYVRIQREALAGMPAVRAFLARAAKAAGV